MEDSHSSYDPSTLMWPTKQNREAWDDRYGHRGRPGGRLPDAVRERLPDLKGKHVLHLPSGPGEVSAELIALGALVTGVDPSDEALAAARERAPDAAFFQAELHELPLQFRRGRFNLVYAGEGTLANLSDLTLFASAVAAALRKNGELILYDWHPVAACVDPVDLRWRESYFAEGVWRLGQIVVAIAETGLALRELEELPPPPSEAGGRLDPRVPTDFVLRATKTEQPERSARLAKR
jgi:SAM-dependent methyltransferase